MSKARVAGAGAASSAPIVDVDRKSTLRDAIVAWQIDMCDKSFLRGVKEFFLQKLEEPVCGSLHADEITAKNLIDSGLWRDLFEYTKWIDGKP